MNINHLHIKVRSVDRACAFYERFFGLRAAARHGDILFMRDDAGMDFALAPKSEAIPVANWFHIGFRLTSPGEVERLYKELTASGATIRQPLLREDDLVSFRCQDPDGYSVEVYWEPQPGSPAWRRRSSRRLSDAADLFDPPLADRQNTVHASGQLHIVRRDERAYAALAHHLLQRREDGP
jgi:catechol 2,3-dioxygenase-like lactoylglutathione lyase family enzyme